MSLSSRHCPAQGIQCVHHSSKFPQAPLRSALPPELITALNYGSQLSIISKMPASNSSRSKYTCSTKTKSRDKNNTFHGVGDPPNRRLSCCECKRGPDLPFLLSGFVPVVFQSVSILCHRLCFSYGWILMIIQQVPEIQASYFFWCST